MNFTISLSVSAKKSAGIDGDFTKSVNQFAILISSLLIMNMECLSIYLFLKFSIQQYFCSFQSINFLLLLLNLLQSISFFQCCCTQNFLNFIQYYSLKIHRTTNDVCILILNPATLVNSYISSSSFQWIPQDLVYAKFYHLQILTVLLFPFQSDCLQTKHVKLEAAGPHASFK